jgi:hypothetical protein
MLLLLLLCALQQPLRQHLVLLVGCINSDQTQPWDGPTEVVSVGLQRDAGGEDGAQQSLEQVLLDAKQQATEPAVLFALCGLGEKPRRLQ